MSFFKRFKFSTKNFRNINFKRYISSKVNNTINFLRYYLVKTYKLIDIRRYNFNKVKKYKSINFSKFFKLNTYKNIAIYFLGAVLSISLIYLTIPFFFNYEKTIIKNKVCKDYNVVCVIKGSIKYSFIPSPRIKIKNLIIQDSNNKNKIFAKADNVIIKLSIRDLMNKKVFNYKKVNLERSLIYLDFVKIKKYDFFKNKKSNLKPISVRNSKIIFLDSKKEIASIKDLNLNYKFSNNLKKLTIKGLFLGEPIIVDLKDKIKKDKKSTILTVKFLESKILTKVNLSNLNLEKSLARGDILFKKGKNRYRAAFSYSDKQLTIEESSLNNKFLNGKLKGEVIFSPFFTFNLESNLSGLNLTKVHNFLSSLNIEDRKKLFKLNNKVNGEISITADKIYSKHNLIKSIESNLKFINGDVSIERFIFDLGKLGAGDLTGFINNNKKFSNFKFESNLFVDNLKKFKSKFGIYKKINVLSNIFISGGFDLINLKMFFYEISSEKKFEKETVDFVEQEFNDSLLAEGYGSFFDFLEFKKFIKLILEEPN
tara:strand:- start:275 stop:1894 length:1620 start_codon:yes stop_codon:yes gene_type:complete